MKRISYIFGVVVAIAACGPIQHEANARGFGGRGGGGGFRGGVSGLSAGGPGGGLRAQGPRDFDGSGAFRGGDLKSSGESHGNFGGGRVNGFTGNPGDVGPVFNGGDAFRESSRPLGGVSIGNTPGRSDLGPHRNAWDAGRPGAMGAGPFNGLHDGPVGGVDLRTPANSARTPGDAGGFDRNPYTDVGRKVWAEVAFAVPMAALQPGGVSIITLAMSAPQTCARKVCMFATTIITTAFRPTGIAPIRLPGQPTTGALVVFGELLPGEP